MRWNFHLSCRIPSLSLGCSKGTTEPDIIMATLNSSVSKDSKPASINKPSRPVTNIPEEGGHNITNQKVNSTDTSMNTTEHMDTIDNNLSSSFAKTYPENYPPDWTLSPANNYQPPDPTNTNAVDPSLAVENERQFSLCLSPFSKEFFIATGYSKLQAPDDYFELIRVIVWHNRQHLKKGLSYLSPP
jgi:hypothetical protein